MKNRRRLEVLLAAILIISLLGGCGQNEVKKGEIYTAYFHGEAVWPYKDADHYTAPNEASVTVNGITYTGTYDKSDDLCYPLPYVFHCYEGDGFRFEIGAHDGKCYSLQPLFYPEVEVCTFDSSHGREIADAIADDYISLCEYQLTESVSTTSHRHVYTYQREVNGINTTDKIIISLNCEGSLCGFAQWQLGAFENVKSVDIDEEKVKAAIEKRCREYYTDQEKVFTSYEIRNTELLLAKTEANQCALLYTIARRFKFDATDEHDTFDWLANMLVIVDYEKKNLFKP